MVEAQAAAVIASHAPAPVSPVVRPLLPPALDLTPAGITESAERFASYYDAEATVHFIIALLLAMDREAVAQLVGIIGMGSGKLALDERPLRVQLAENIATYTARMARQRARNRGSAEAPAPMAKAEFDRLVAVEEKRLGKEAVALIMRAHLGGRYRTDWPAILEELAGEP
jgi:hypothetical protein